MKKIKLPISQILMLFILSTYSCEQLGSEEKATNYIVKIYNNSGDSVRVKLTYSEQKIDTIIRTPYRRAAETNELIPENVGAGTTEYGNRYGVELTAQNFNDYLKDVEISVIRNGTEIPIQNNAYFEDFNNYEYSPDNFGLLFAENFHIYRIDINPEDLKFN